MMPSHIRMASSCLNVSHMDPFQIKFDDFHKLHKKNNYSGTVYLDFTFRENGSSTLRKAEDLTPRDIAGGGGASAQHCTGMTNWLNTIHCLGADDIMSLGINYFAT